MNRIRLGLICGVGMLSLTIMSCTPAETTSSIASWEDENVLENGDIIPDRYIVVLKPESEFAGKTTREVLEEMTTAEGVSATQRYETALVGFAGDLSSSALTRMRSDSRVAYIEPDRVITLPAPVTAQSPKWCTPEDTHPACVGEEDPATEGQTTPWGIQRVGNGDGTGKTIWVIDSGVDLDHRDLLVDTGRSRSFLSGKEANNPDDQNGHGTHVAGTVAGLNNAFDVVGVAAGATVVSVRVLDRRGSGTYSAVIAGVDYVGANGAPGDVANMSLGGPASAALDQAIYSASGEATGVGVLFALAAGNSGDDAGNYSPARVNGPNIVTVSAFGAGDGWASFSNYGNPPVDYAGPGVNILSLWKNGGTNTISGTSMATPHVAGLLLLDGDTTLPTDGTVAGDPDGVPDPIAHQ